MTFTTRLRILIHAHLSPRPLRNHTSEKFTVVPPEHPMGKEKHQQLIRRDDGLMWWSRHKRTRGHLHVVAHYTGVGLYRDDGLAICKATPKHIEKTQQEVREIFKTNGLKTHYRSKQENHKLVTLGLTSRSYKPFMKPNNKSSTSTDKAITHPHYWKASQKTSTND